MQTTGWLNSLMLAAALIVAGPVHSADPPDASAAFFDPATIQTVRLEIAEPNLDRMKAALPRRITVPGTFGWGDERFERVGIRYKGNSSSPPNWPHKRSFLVDFRREAQGGLFLGLEHVALDNAIQFGGLFSEHLITEILREAGIPASRCNHTRLLLNGKPAGVYVNVERIDRPFLGRHFRDSSGPLFKVDEGGPAADLKYLGANPALYKETFELLGGDEAQARAELIAFLRTLNDPATRPADLERVLNLDAFLKTTAILLLAGAFDQYTGWNPHNYYLYRNPGDGRWTYIPWDLDVGFADNAFGKVPVLEGWNAAWPAPVPGRPLMERIVSDPALLARYRTFAREALDRWFHPDRLIPKLNELHRRLAPALADDPFPRVRVTVPSDTGTDQVVESIAAFIRRRHALATAQLANPGPRPKPMPMATQDEGPRPGPPSADAPTDLQAKLGPDNSVQLTWTDRSEGEVAFVVQRCEGEDCSGFQNAIGLPGAGTTRAEDRSIQPGRTYRYRVYAVHPTPQGPRGTGPSAPVTITTKAR